MAFVCAAIAARSRVVHISSHSFTPRLGGVARRADVGLLYVRNGGAIAAAQREAVALALRDALRLADSP